MPIFGEGALRTILTRVNTILGLVQTPVYWKTQKPVDYFDNTIVQNAWENVVANLSGGVPARIWYIIVVQTNNGAAAETIELAVTINGIVHTATMALNSGALYHGYISYDLVAGTFFFHFAADTRTMGASRNTNQAIPFDAETVSLVRVHQTTGVDPAGASIEVNIAWELLTRAPAM